MKIRIILLILTLITALAAVNNFTYIAIHPVSATPTVDGKPDDWGPSGFLKNDWSVNKTWVPHKNVKFIVEDNSNPLSGKSYSGIHIKGEGSKFTFYDEKQVIHKEGYPVWEPFGSPEEDYDIEAMYIQQDDDNIYVLIVTSLVPDAGGGAYSWGFKV